MFGLPFINEATLQLPNGKLLNIQVKGSTNQAHRNKITAIHFNGKSIPVHSITHQQLLAGGKLIITVSK
jgi:putative alpha-1,2-mannosidase